MNIRKPIRFWSILIVALFSAGVVWAQSVNDGTISGTTSLSSGERIAGVTIKVTSPALVSGERTTTSDNEGRFVFLSVPPGTYNLSASMQGVTGENSSPGPASSVSASRCWSLS